MSNNKLVIIILVSVLALVVVSSYVTNKFRTPEGVEASENARVEFGETRKDRGEVKINQGLLVTDFLIKNVGSDPLILYDVSTSCMCTVATIEIDGVSSPEFKMGERSSYTAMVLPGGTATVKLIFDPAFHGPNGVGPVTRQVMMRTNDSSQPKLEFIISATVVK